MQQQQQQQRAHLDVKKCIARDCRCLQQNGGQKTWRGDAKQRSVQLAHIGHQSHAVVAARSRGGCARCESAASRNKAKRTVDGARRQVGRAEQLDTVKVERSGVVAEHAQKNALAR